MTREDYKKQIESIDNEIRSLEMKKRDIAEEYVQANSDATLLGKRVVVEHGLSNGQKKITTAWLDSYEVSQYSSKIVPVLYRDKRDGTRSKNRFFPTCVLKIEVATEDNIPQEPQPRLLEETCASNTCGYRGTGVCTYEEGQFCPSYVKKK